MMEYHIISNDIKVVMWYYDQFKSNEELCQLSTKNEIASQRFCQH